MEMNQKQSEAAYAAGYYKEKLEIGKKFEDYICMKLCNHGIFILGFASKEYQQMKGENLLGAEIKRDDKFRQTGNLYIETAEKSNPNKPNYFPSGVMRDDNSWLYIIGDEIEVYIHSKKYLRMLASKFNKVQTPTSQGFLMPLAEADKYCLKKVEL